MRHDRGAATDMHRAEQFLYTATAQIASTQRDIEQTENALSLLLGRMPSDIARGKTLDQFTLPAEVPPGLPSSRSSGGPTYARRSRPSSRPTRRSARRRRSTADFAERIRGRPEPRSLGSVHRSGPRLDWRPERGVAAADLQRGPDPGRRAPQRSAEARDGLHQKTIHNAFREVSDALAGYDHTRRQRTEQELLVTALTETTRLSTLRYQGGLDSYLQVLDAERNLFQGQLALAKLRLQEMLWFVQIYRALGGGWQ